MTCNCHTSTYAMLFWRTFAMSIIATALLILGCSQSAHAQDASIAGAMATTIAGQDSPRSVIVVNEQGQHVIPKRSGLAPLPLDQEYVETCRVSGQMEENPNYKDPAKSFAGVGQALGRLLATGAAAKTSAPGPAIASVEAINDSVTIVRENAQPADSHNRYVWIEREKCSYVSRVRQPSTYDRTNVRPANKDPSKLVQLTKDDVLKLQSDGIMPQPIGGNLYQMRGYDGRMVVGTLYQLSEYQQRHYNLCFALTPGSVEYNREHCDK